jgi:hypothetical protein
MGAKVVNWENEVPAHRKTGSSTVSALFIANFERGKEGKNYRARRVEHGFVLQSYKENDKERILATTCAISSTLARQQYLAIKTLAYVQ